MLLDAYNPTTKTTSTTVYTDTVAYNLLELKPAERLVYKSSEPFSAISVKTDSRNIKVITALATSLTE